MIYDWQIVKEPTIDELEENKPIEVFVGNREVGLLKLKKGLYAFAAKCPHASGRFCEGWMDAQGRLVCPIHKYRFDPVNGRNTSGEGYKLKTFPVEIREGNIYIGLW